MNSDDTPGLRSRSTRGGNFCAGMDLKAFASGELPHVPGPGIGFTEQPPRKPLIAAVEGYALAGGTEIVPATDLRWPPRWPSRHPRRSNADWPRAGEAACCGRPRIPQQSFSSFFLFFSYLLPPRWNLPAEEAAAWGFVNKLTEPGEALAGALFELAERITANVPLAAAVTKEIITKSAWGGPRTRCGSGSGRIDHPRCSRRRTRSKVPRRSPKARTQLDWFLATAWISVLGAATVVVSAEAGVWVRPLRSVWPTTARVAVVGRRREVLEAAAVISRTEVPDAVAIVAADIGDPT